MPRDIVKLLFPLFGTLTAVDGIRGDVPRLRGGAYLAGLQSHSVTTAPDGSLVMLGLGLSAEACRAVLPLPAREVTNLTIEAALIFKNTPELFERLRRATSSFSDQCRILLRWLESVVEPSPRLTQVHHACSVLARTPQDARVDRIARDMAVSSRHLRRVFLEYVGVTPLEYARLQRFRRALNLMPSDLNLTAIAHESHYYDQAHLCHDFRDIAGITPGEYRAQAGPISGLLFAPDVRPIQFREQGIG
jgi:AraC-like DNA-binding protein